MRTAERVRRAGQGLRKKSAVLLPDFYVDRFIPVPALSRFEADVRTIHTRGGGNLPTMAQTVRIGGDAANAAYALARLGVRCRLVAHADPLGRSLLEGVLGPLGVDLGGVKEAPRSAGTVALEFEDGSNVMLSDAGPLAGFGPGDLDDDDWSAIVEADAVLIGNWSQTFEQGTPLLRAVLDRSGPRGVFTLLDTSDPTHRGDAARQLIEDPEALKGLSCWSLNENEAAHFAGVLTGGRVEDIEEAAKILAGHFGFRIDAHSSERTYSIEAGKLTRVDVPPVTPRRRTGAGDAWNAGNIAGTLLGLSPADRLELASAVAGCLLASETHEPPSIVEVVAWMEDHPAPQAADAGRA